MCRLYGCHIRIMLATHTELAISPKPLFVALAATNISTKACPCCGIVENNTISQKTTALSGRNTHVDVIALILYRSPWRHYLFFPVFDVDPLDIPYFASERESSLAHAQSVHTRLMWKGGGGGAFGCCWEFWRLPAKRT